MIRMLYVGGQTASEKGAVGTHTAGIISALKRNPQVELLGSFYESALPKSVPDDSFFYREPRITSMWGKPGKLLSIFFYSLFVRKTAKHVGAQYVYVRFDPVLCFFVSFLLKRYNIIIEYNDLFMSQIEFAAERGQWGEGISKKIRLSILYRRFILTVESVSFSRAYLVVAVTESLLSYCRKIGMDVNGVVVKNATDLQIDESSNFPFNDDQVLRMAHVGTLTYWDGLEELFQAVKLAYQKSPKFRCELVVVGDGKMTNALLRAVKTLEIEESVIFFDAIPQDKAIEHLKSCDVVPLLKTMVDYGLSPMKFYEALGAGCHILASDVPHMNEDSGKFVTNVSFPLDVEEISDKLLALHTEVREIRASRVDTSQYAALNHSWDSRVRVLVDQLEAGL